MQRPYARTVAFDDGSIAQAHKAHRSATMGRITVLFHVTCKDDIQAVWRNKATVDVAVILGVDELTVFAISLRSPELGPAQPAIGLLTRWPPGEDYAACVRKPVGCAT